MKIKSFLIVNELTMNLFVGFEARFGDADNLTADFVGHVCCEKRKI